MVKYDNQNTKYKLKHIKQEQFFRPNTSHARLHPHPPCIARGRWGCWASCGSCSDKKTAHQTNIIYFHYLYVSSMRYRFIIRSTWVIMRRKFLIAMSIWLSSSKPQTQTQPDCQTSTQTCFSYWAYAQSRYNRAGQFLGLGLDLHVFPPLFRRVEPTKWIMEGWLF